MKKGSVWYGVTIRSLPPPKREVGGGSLNPLRATYCEESTEHSVGCWGELEEGEKGKSEEQREFQK